MHALFGGDVRWQRLANLLLHAATGIALLALLRRLFGETRLAFFGALWFVVHPVAVYGAGYLMQRSSVMATLFSIVALTCVLEGLQARRPAWYAAAALAYLLALSSKEHAIMLPAVAAALAVRVRGWHPAALRPAAFPLALCAALAIAAVAQRLDVLGGLYEPFGAPLMERLGVPAAAALPLSLENQATLFFRYLATWIFPWPGWMSVDLRTVFPTELLGWHTAGFAAWLAWPVACGWLLTRGGHAGLAGLALLSPWLLALTEMATVRVQEPFVLYRSYLWMFLLPAALPAVLHWMRDAWRPVAAGALCLVMAAGAHERLKTFSGAYALWDDAARKNTDPSAPFAERALYSRGLVALDTGRLEEARRDLERAVEINPASPDARLTRGTYRLQTRQFAAALEDFDRAIAIDPAYASAYNQRCVVRAELRRFGDALQDCERAVKLNPADDVAWINRGAVYRELGRPQDAVASFERALALKPMSASAHYNLGTLLLDSGRRDTAVLGHLVIACQGGVADACAIVKRSRVEKK